VSPASRPPVLTLGRYTSRRRHSPNRTRTRPLALIKRVVMRFCAVRPGMSRVEQKNRDVRRRASNCPEFRASAVFDPRGLHYMAGGANTVMVVAVVNSVSIGLFEVF